MRMLAVQVLPELFEVRLARDQAQAQAKRLKERVDELTAQLAAASGGASTSATAKRAATGKAGAAGGAGSVSAAREAELLSTITTLKAALEKAITNTTPTTKYMQVCRKESSQRC